jgi:CRISPR type I-E-associated protein CasB/Cse2
MTMQADREKDLDAIFGWWKALHEREPGTGARAGRAELRRCSNLNDAMMVPVAHQLLRSAKGGTRVEDLLLVAIVLASMNTNTGDNPRISLAKALGQTADGRSPAESDRQRMSPLRFQSLLAAMTSADPTLRIRALRRAVALSGDAGFDVRRLADDIIRFNDHVQRRWIFDYWQAFEPRGTASDDTATGTKNS